MRPSLLHLAEADRSLNFPMANRAPYLGDLHSQPDKQDSDEGSRLKDDGVLATGHLKTGKLAARGRSGSELRLCPLTTLSGPSP